jgi:glycerophosphoryl diester phosphodiesterase
MAATGFEPFRGACRALRGDAMPDQNPTLTGRRAIRAAARAWKGLVSYEIVMSLFAMAVLGPLAATMSYRLIELSGETVLGNTELAWFLLSPRGMLALVLVLSVGLGLVLTEYSGLILLLRAAFRGIAVSPRQVVAALFAAAPRLLVVALVQTVCALAATLPFFALAAAVYWLLLSSTDINYYLYERPPRFWVAAAIGIVLGVGVAATTIWFFARFAFAAPCVLDGQSSWQALASGARLVRGRTLRLLFIIGAWLLVQQAVLIAAIAGLDRLNAFLLSAFESRLTLLVASTVSLLVLDAAALQLLRAVSAIGLAAILTFEYERAGGSFQPAAAEPRLPATPAWPAWQTRAAVAAVVILAPAASLFYAVALSREFVEGREAMVTAHRAGSAAAPENSLAALARAIAVGADFVEIDVQQTADGHVVLLHDRDLRRVTGDARELNDVQLADLADLRLRGRGGANDERIPTLDEFLAACDDRIRLNVELKDFGRTPNLAMAVLDVLRARNFVGRAVVSSFDLAPLVELREAEPNLQVGMILTAAKGDILRFPVDFFSLNERMARADVVRRAHRRGMQVHVWTVNDRESAIRFLDLGCDNLITSDPAMMREVVDWYAELDDGRRILMRLRRWMRE